MEHSANAFAVSANTVAHDLEVVRLRQRTTADLLDFAANVVDFPGAATELQRKALAHVLRDRAQDLAVLIGGACR